VNYICDELFYAIEQKIDDLCENLPMPFIGKVLYVTIFPWGRWQKKPSDRLGQELADLMLAPNESFDRMTQGLFLSKAKDNFLYDLKETQRKVFLAEDLEKQLRKADKEKIIKGLTEEDLVNDALRLGIINHKEYDQLLTMVRARAEIIAVDAFNNL
jgi:acyl-CoA dehydrogenase